MIRKRFPFSSFPAGVYAIAFSDDIKRNKKIVIHWMNISLEIFRNDAGELIINEKFPIFEQYGLIFLNYHLKNLSFPEWKKEEWSLSIPHYFKIRSHPQEILENTVDKLHFYHVHHYASVTQLGSPKLTGPEFELSYHLERRNGVFGFDRNKKIKMQLDIHIYGLGLSEVIVTLPDYHLIAKQVVCPTPIDGEFIHIRALTSLKIPTGLKWIPYSLKRYFTNILCKMAAKGFLQDFLPDIHIWENKRFIENPKYLPNDGDFEIYRNWARQFYLERSERPRENMTISGNIIQTEFGK